MEEADDKIIHLDWVE